MKLKSGYDQYKEHSNFYYDLSAEGDINDLLLVTDILITDYSSILSIFLDMQAFLNLIHFRKIY